MITPPLPFQLRHDHPAIIASYARSHAAMALVRRARTATLGPVPTVGGSAPGSSLIPSESSDGGPQS